MLAPAPPSCACRRCCWQGSTGKLRSGSGGRCSSKAEHRLPQVLRQRLQLLLLLLLLLVAAYAR